MKWPLRSCKGSTGKTSYDSKPKSTSDSWGVLCKNAGKFDTPFWVSVSSCCKSGLSFVTLCVIQRPLGFLVDWCVCAYMLHLQVETFDIQTVWDDMHGSSIPNHWIANSVHHIWHSNKDLQFCCQLQTAVPANHREKSEPRPSRVFLHLDFLLEFIQTLSSAINKHCLVFKWTAWLAQYMYFRCFHYSIHINFLSFFPAFPPICSRKLDHILLKWVPVGVSGLQFPSDRATVWSVVYGWVFWVSLACQIGS